MKFRIRGTGLILVLVATGIVNGQDCGCGSAPQGGHRHIWPGPYGGANCGREYSQSQAEALWAGYCTENCSLCGRGCGGNCGLRGAGACGPCAEGVQGFVGNASGGDKRFGHHSGHLANLFSGHGHGAECGVPGELGGKGLGRSLFGGSHWGGSSGTEGGIDESCGDGGTRGGGEHLRQIGRAGRLFQADSCDSGCDQGAGEVVPPHASSVPTSFHRYHSGGPSGESSQSITLSDLPTEEISGPVSGSAGK